MPNWDKKRILQCSQCGGLCPGTLSTDGEFVPAGAASGGRCHQCGNDEFEQVVLASSN